MMGFTVERAAGRVARDPGRQEQPHPGLRRPRRARSRSKPDERSSASRKSADRGQLPAQAASGRKAGGDSRGAAAALDSHRRRARLAATHRAGRHADPAADRRAPPHGQPLHPARAHRADRAHALEPAFERLGAGRDARSRSSTSRSATRRWARAPSWSRPAGSSATRWIDAWARHPDTRPTIPADEDEDLHARRLVAQRCLYGVDKNPMAVDLAKLSLWLATLAQDHAFTFLDHALQHGDSLVGLSRDADRGVPLEARDAAGLLRGPRSMQDRIADGHRARAADPRGGRRRADALMQREARHGRRASEPAPALRQPGRSRRSSRRSQGQRKAGATQSRAN